MSSSSSSSSVVFPLQFDEEFLRMSFRVMLNLPNPPIHSNFRVVCLMVYSQQQEKTTIEDNESLQDGALLHCYSPYTPFYQQSATSQTSTCPLVPPPLPIPSSLASLLPSSTPPLYYCVGSNVELCFTGLGICAERACLSSLRLYPYRKIHRTFVVSDIHNYPLEMGCLCREFMHNFITRHSPILIGAKMLPNEQKNNQDSTDNKIPQLQLGAFSDDKTGNSFNFGYRTVTLAQLYPYPPIYLNIPASKFNAAMKFFSENRPRTPPPMLPFTSPEEESNLISLLSSVVALDDREEIHSIRLGALCKFANGHVEFHHQTKLLEYGYTLDPVSKLIPFIENESRKGNKPLFIVQADIFMNFHCPHSPARAHVIEGGWGQCLSIFHDDKGILRKEEFQSLIPGSVGENLKAALKHF